MTSRATTDKGRNEITRLLSCWSGGDATALEHLVPLVYQELRRLAGGYMRRERTGHTLQPTALVHEAFVRMVDQTHVEFRSRAHFFGAASNLMRQILVNHALRAKAAKRGGGRRVTFDDSLGLSVAPAGMDVLALDDALTKLAALDPRQSRIIELRYFGGLTEEEIAELLEISVSTVKREWRFAKEVLRKQLAKDILS